jgi:exonuclease SbcD
LAYRFVHAADIHLDSPLRSLALRDPALAELIGNATRRAFVAVVDLCLEQQVDALLLAGDLHDGDQTSMKTARFLAEQMRRLDEAGIQVFVIRGNHDALSKITKELTFPDSVKLFGPRAEFVVPERKNGNAPVVIHGLSFAKSQAPESLLPQYAAPAEGAVNIGLMHTSLDGAAGHDPYAPCNVGDLKAAGFRYWALGHVHKRAVVEGGCTIVMPGMPQGRDINEAGPKSVTLVTVMDDGAIRIEEHVTSLAQFERVEADIAGIEDWRDMLDMAAKALGAARGRTVSKYLVARLHLTGATPLAWRMLRDADLLTEELKERAALAGDCWIERVEIDCTAPDVGGGAADNPVLELRRLIAEEVVGSDAYQAEVMRIAEELRGQLPVECRTLLGADEEAFKAAVAGLVREGSDDVLARLYAKTGTAD